MFGLNKNKKDKDKQPKPFFEFPLEDDIKDEKKVEAMVKDVEGQIKNIKKLVKDGSKKEEFENLGTLLHGYSALLKVLTGSVEEEK